MSRQWIVRGLLVLVLLCAVSLELFQLPAAAQGPGPLPNRFEVLTELRGFEEVPSINTTAHGDFRAVVTPDAIRFELLYSGFQSTILFAHIHIAQRPVNGGIMVFLCGGGGQPDCPQSSGRVTGTITAANVQAVPAQGIAAGDFAAVVRAIHAGVAYANVHSVTFPTGEIRGWLRRPEIPLRPDEDVD